jgi:Zinc knuckle
MEGANKGFKPLLRDLENDYVLGANKYPALLVEALQVLMVYAEQPVYKLIMKKLKKKQLVETDEGSPEVAFAPCFHCGEKGHKASECKKNRKEDEETAQRDNMHMQQQLLWMA